MTGHYNYNQHMEVAFEQLQRIDVNKLIEACKETWYNQTLTKVNGSVVRLGIVEGDYHWHQHEADDEFFFVLSGKLIIELQSKSVERDPRQGVTIPMGIMHRPHAPQKTVMLMVETAAIDPIGQEV